MTVHQASRCKSDIADCDDGDGVERGVWLAADAIVSFVCRQDNQLQLYRVTEIETAET
jgi:hypothetical protein